MAYRNKVYVAFDGDNDMQYYNLMRAWANNSSIDFDFHDAHEINYSHDWAQTESIKRQLHERLENSKIFILLIGESTRRLTRFVEYEVETAMRMQLPIICVNLNGSRCADYREPSWFNGYPRVHVSFKEKIIKHAIETWPNDTNSKYGRGAYSYQNYIYSYYGLF